MTHAFRPAASLRDVLAYGVASALDEAFWGLRQGEGVTRTGALAHRLTGRLVDGAIRTLDAAREALAGEDFTPCGCSAVCLARGGYRVARAPDDTEGGPFRGCYLHALRFAADRQHRGEYGAVLPPR